METVLTAQPVVTATTPAPVLTATGPAPTVTTPEVQSGAATTPAPEVAATPEVPQHFLRAETGTVYNDREAAERGIAEKDRYIEILRHQNELYQSQLRQQPTQAPPQADPVAEVAARLERQYEADPAYADIDAQSRKLLARANALGVIEARRESERTAQQFTAKMQHETFVAQHAELSEPIGQEVYNRHIQMYGRPFDSPQQHLDAVHAEMYRRGIASKSPTTAAAAAAQGVMNGQTQAARVFGTAGTGTTPPPATQVNTFAAEAMQYAQSRITDPAQLAIANAIAAQTNPASFGIRR